MCFGTIELTALMELNNVIFHAERRKIDTSSSEALKLLPNAMKVVLDLDLRISMAWDTDNTDIDLWVIEPSGEKVYYGNKTSSQGGLISRDFIRGLWS